MPKKISRDIALIKFRKLPLQEYDRETDTEIFYYPKSFSFFWIKLEKHTTKKLSTEFKKLVEALGLHEFVILGQINKPWISKFTRERKDYLPLVKAIDYFDSIKVKMKFNGAIQITQQELNDFIPNFYTVTRCDGGFYDYYISDVGENILFHIHYSGEIKILTLNTKFGEKLSEAIRQTMFTDSLREESDRIK